MIHETKITYTTLDNKGYEKVVKQNYLISDATSFADAETQISEALPGSALKDFDVVAIKRSNIREIINKRISDEERIFVAEVADTQYNEDGEEVVFIYKMALYAKDFDRARSTLVAYLCQGYNMEIVGLKCTKFIDII